MEVTETIIRRWFREAETASIRLSTDKLEQAIVEVNKLIAREGLHRISVSPSCKNCFYSLNDMRYHDESMKCKMKKSNHEEYARELWERLEESISVLDAMRAREEVKRLKDQLQCARDAVHRHKNAETRLERKMNESKSEVSELKQNMYRLGSAASRYLNEQNEDTAARLNNWIKYIEEEGMSELGE